MQITSSGTNIDDVKRRNSQAGMSYNEAKAYIAKTTGGHNTRQFTDTDIEIMKQKLNNH